MTPIFENTTILRKKFLEKIGELLYLDMDPKNTTTYKLLCDTTFMNGEDIVWEKLKAEFVTTYIRAEMGGNKGIHRLEEHAQ